jgi:zinc D-Ala-D-Ala carboxypeptidase
MGIGHGPICHCSIRYQGDQVSPPIAVVQNWGKYAPFFQTSEFACSHCGKSLMQPVFMDRLFQLRQRYNRPMRITSGYRCDEHPIEARKVDGPGAHATGRAADVSVSGREAFELIRLATELGFTGIGVQQKGQGRFIHLDDVPDSLRFVRPIIWSY